MLEDRNISTYVELGDRPIQDSNSKYADCNYIYHLLINDSIVHVYWAKYNSTIQKHCTCKTQHLPLVALCVACMYAYAVSFYCFASVL